MYPLQPLYEYSVDHEQYPSYPPHPKFCYPKNPSLRCANMRRNRGHALLCYILLLYLSRERRRRVHGLMRTRYPPRRPDTIAQCRYKHVARARSCVRVYGRYVLVYPVMCAVRLRRVPHGRRNIPTVMENTSRGDSVDTYGHLRVTSFPIEFRYLAIPGAVPCLPRYRCPLHAFCSIVSLFFRNALCRRSAASCVACSEDPNGSRRIYLL